MGCIIRTTHALITCVIKLYQYVLSPWIGSCCRFSPSCSNYMQKALYEHGLFKGTYYGVWRILRCHPGSHGGYDPVPINLKPE
jgi:uncharacterized protein